MSHNLIQNFADPTIIFGASMQVLASNSEFDKWIVSYGEITSVKDITRAFFTAEYSDKFLKDIENGVNGKYPSKTNDLIEVTIIPLNVDGTIAIFKTTAVRNGSEPSNYKWLIEKSPIATAIYRPDGSPKYYNQAYGNIWGAPKEVGRKLVSSNAYNIFKDEQLQDIGLTPFIRKGFNGEIVDIPPVKYNPANTKSLAQFGIDNEKYIKGHIYPVIDGKGTVQEIALVISDITFQMQAEEILTENHLKFQLLTMGLPGVIYEYAFDGKTNFKFLSQGSIEMFGYTPEEIINDHTVITSMIHKDDIDEFNRSSIEAAKNAEPWEWQGRFVVNGTVKWIEGKSNTRGSNPNVRYGMLLDVTERVIAERKSKYNELLLGQLFNNSPLGLVLLDEDHNVVQINHGFEEIFRFSQSELVGKRLNDLIVPPGESKAALDINTLTAKGKVGKLESVRLDKNGKNIPVIIYGVPVSLEDETIGIYGIYVDITERTRIENELKVRNDELDNFVYKVSHDLRAPLSSVLGLVNLARLEKSTDNLREYVQMIENRIKLLDAFINDVLSHSKNLKLEVQLGEIDLKKVIDQCFEDLSYLPNAGLVEVSVTIAGESFYSDQWRMNEIFRNLISNSIKYIDSTKDQSFVKIDVNVSASCAKITIQDNGIGISKSNQTKVFDMFYRATETSEGSGIGLYIVKNALNKLGGQIKVSSEEDKGTKFEINIPNQMSESN
ncbi:MAG: PAS domain-containing sensor histidine kinase [Bacteroidota bacterium]